MIAIQVLEKLLKNGDIDLIRVNLEQIEKLIREETDRWEDEFNDLIIDYKPSRWSIGVYHDWDSFMFWQPMNWRNFTWFELSTETNSYLKYLELRFAILGFHIEIDWYRPIGDKPCKTQ